MVFEEDTNLILTVDQDMHFEEEHPIRLMTAIHRARKHEPGMLVRNGKSWYAVVVDLEREQMCDESWVSTAYDQIYSECKKKWVSTMAIHLLGTVHARLPIGLAVTVLVDKLKAHQYPALRQVWVIVTKANLQAVRQSLDKLT